GYGLAFSRDGTALAALLGTTRGTRLVLWETATGKRKATHNLSPDPRSQLGAYKGGQGRAVEWFPDGSGLLLYNQFFVDAATGAVYPGAPELTLADQNQRRVFGSGILARLQGQGFDQAVTFEPAPRRPGAGSP